MNSKTTLPISEARKKIFELAEEVQKPGQYYVLTEKGRAKAVLLSADEFASWQETLEVMKDFPELKFDIQQAEADFQTGKFTTLAGLLARQGFVLAEKEKKTYAASRHHSQKGRTGTRKRKA